LYVRKHGLSAAPKSRTLFNHLIGFTLAASAALVTNVSLSPTATAAGSVWDRVAACESGGRWNINTGNGFSGGLQFSASTWRAYGGTRYASSASEAGKSAQIAVARRVLASQGPGAWPTCGSRAGLTRSSGSGGYSVSTVSRARTRVAVHTRTRSVAPSRLRVDGLVGPRTVSAIQRWVGVPQTGAFGPRTTRALQRRVGAYPDGNFGPRTIHVLQVRIGAQSNGERRLSPATVVALQRHLNRQLTH
jgi:hypothetical protein